MATVSSARHHFCAFLPARMHVCESVWCVRHMNARTLQHPWCQNLGAGWLAPRDVAVIQQVVQQKQRDGVAAEVAIAVVLEVLGLDPAQHRHGRAAFEATWSRAGAGWLPSSQGAAAQPCRHASFNSMPFNFNSKFAGHTLIQTVFVQQPIIDSKFNNLDWMAGGGCNWVSVC